MKKRPLSLSVLTSGQLLVVILMLLVLNFAWSEGDMPATNLAGNLGMGILLLVVSCLIGAWMSSFGSRFMVLTGLIVLSSSALVIETLRDPEVAESLGHGAFPIMAITGAALLLQVCLLAPSSLAVIRNPKERWWMQAVRKVLNIPVRLNAGDVSFDLVSFDASETGMFLSYGDDAAATPRGLGGLVERGDPIEVAFDLGQRGGLVTLEAEISRIQLRPDGGYPTGCGVRFLSPTGPGYASYVRLVNEAQVVSRSGPPAQRRSA